MPRSPEQISVAEGEIHRYRLSLKAGDYCQLRVQQLGADVLLVLLGPSGVELARTDSPNGRRGGEEVAVVADTAGEHVLQIHGASTGEYRIELVAQRPATDEDRRRAEALAQLQRGELLRQAGRMDEAEAFLATALEGFRGLGDPGPETQAREADALDRLARCAQAQGHQQEALKLQRQAVDALPETAPPEQRSAALARLGLLTFELGDLDAAVAAWRRALPLRPAEEDPAGRGRLLHNLGHAHQRRGEAQRALEAYEEALELHRQAAHRRGEAETLHNLGVLEEGLGEVERAHRHLAAAAEVWRKLGNASAHARTLDRLGLLELASGDAGRAAERFTQALDLRPSNNSPEAAVSLANLALARRHQGRSDEAMDLQRQALEIFIAVGDPLGEARCRENLGHLERHGGRLEHALEEHRRALDLYRRLRDPAGESSALYALALDFQATGQSAESLEAIGAALDLLEDQRDLIDAAALRRAFFATVEERYELAVELLMEQARAEPHQDWAWRALAASERARSRSLLDALSVPRGKARGIRSVGASPPSEEANTRLAEREATLAARLSATARLRTELLAASSGNGAALARIEIEIEELARQLDDARGKIARRQESPNTAQSLAANELARWVGAEEILLEFHLGREESYLWILDQQRGAPRLTTHTLPPVRRFADLARRAHELLASSHRREAEGALRPVLCQLSRELLAPVAEHLDSKRVLVVADGPLLYLPFGALPDPRSGGPCEQAPPLLAHQPVVSLPSLSSRRAAAERPGTPPEESLAILADPAFEPGEPGAAAGPPRLPGTRREAQRIADLAPQPPFLALGTEARKELFTSSALTPYRWLHLATHARVDEDRPELSSLLLAQRDDAGRAVDGQLLLHEIAGLELRSRLVTLSACRSALGREVRGEGLVGLTGAFLQAGAQQVLVSLWDVSDDATAELMSRFYRGLLQQRLPPEEALREAQLALLAEPRWRAPYHWAGFVLYGQPP
ncbi:MAG: CHAT domain-containing protein [Acidobacteriota bacterium]|nr:CHAT domain-containing protein [Acidobacteriota bacterium]